MVKLTSLNVYALLSHAVAITCHSLAPTNISPIITQSAPLPTTGPSIIGDWTSAKKSLRNPSCCVVKVSGLEHHLSVLKWHFCGPNRPNDLDLRMKIRCGRNEHDEKSMAYEDCSNIFRAITPPSLLSFNSDNYSTNQRQSVDNDYHHSIITALEVLARGMATLADGPLDGVCTDVHMRIVCASTYHARDPMFHTDKCPMRGYVTLIGPGTEYMDKTCLPWDYAVLRTLGTGKLSGVIDGKTTVKGLREAAELEFIVMKGDTYSALDSHDTTLSILHKLYEQFWGRASACVHRSPPAPTTPVQRLIISLDLADGKDDQEWLEFNRKREWRSGMTQRKSRLVV